jgi:pSer/pThr/pTyr-binding forkhead associated (FHA) protein
MTIYWLKHRGTLFPVPQGDCLLGRNPDCLIVLTSERVSREHAVVRRIHTGLEIEDLGSRNGTWVNGARIVRPAVLEPGDEVQLGEDVLEVVVQPNPQVAVTVSGVASPLTEERERQRRSLEWVEGEIGNLAPDADRAAAAPRLRELVDDLLERQEQWGVVLSSEETQRLADVAQTLASWARSRQFERWSRDVMQYLARRLPSSEGPRSSR